MSNILPLKCRRISDRDGWIRVIWETEINGQEESIDSGYGPDLRSTFLQSIQEMGVNFDNLFSLVAKQNIWGRVYKSKKGWHVAPDVYSKGGRAGLAQPKFTNTPFASKVGSIQPAALKGMVTPVTKLTPGVKGADTKLLNKIADGIDLFLKRVDEDENLIRAESPDFVKKTQKYALELSTELRSRK